MDRNELTQHLKRFLDSQRSVRTQQTYRKGLEYLARHWPKGEEGRPLVDITSARLAAAANAFLRMQRCAPGTFNTYTSCWMSWSRYLHEEGVIDRIPKRPPYITVERERPIRAVPTSDEVTAVWKWLWTDVAVESMGATKVIRDRAMFTMLAFAGMRRGEISRFPVSNWCEDTRTLTVQGKRLRIRKLTLPKNAKTVQSIRDACAGKGPGDMVVDASDSVILYRTNALFSTVCERTDITPHSLRNFLCERLWARGLPAPHIMRIMGHTHIQTTMQYDLSRYTRKDIPQILMLEDDEDHDGEEQDHDDTSAAGTGRAVG